MEEDSDSSPVDEPPLEDELKPIKKSGKAKTKDIDYVLSFHIPDNSRQILTLVLLVASFLSVNFAVTFMILSWYVKSTLQKQIIFLQNFYQPNAVPAVLFVSGVFVLASSLMGMKAAIAGRAVADKSEAKEAAVFFFVSWILGAVTVFFILVTAFTCLLEIRQLESALDKGLKAAMEKYRTEGALKSEIDMLQMDYKCCGVDSYKDWYNISWVDVKYLDVQDNEIKKMLKDGLYYGKDVPFSCCKWTELRPCVDTRIEDNDYHSKYDFKTDLTLHQKGCREALIAFLGFSVFRGVGLFVLACLILWIAMTILTRYLHTSLHQISVGKAPIGWIVPFVMKHNKVPQKAKVKATPPGKRELLPESSEDEDNVNLV